MSSDLYALEAEMHAEDQADQTAHPVQAVHMREADRTVLDAVRTHLGTYLMPASESDLDLLALWAVHTHVAVESYTTPRLIINSPMKGSGKTTVLEHLERLAPHATQMSNVSSVSLIARVLKAREPGISVLLIDEAEKSLHPNKIGIDEILAILNSGYKRGGSRPVLEKSSDGNWVPIDMPTFAPVAMAGNAPDLPDDTMDRSITVLMFPAQDGEVEESDWELIEPDVIDLGYAIAEWADTIRDELRRTRPDVPKGCTGRMKERWLPLKRVAVFAGGDWPARVDRMILHNIEEAQNAKEEGLILMRPHIQLVHDIHAVFESRGLDFLPTTDDLLPMLKATNPRSWVADGVRSRDLTAQGMGRMLTKNFSIHSDRAQDSAQTRGYYRSDFEKAWRALGITK